MILGSFYSIFFQLQTSVFTFLIAYCLFDYDFKNTVFTFLIAYCLFDYDFKNTRDIGVYLKIAQYILIKVVYVYINKLATFIID